jgi:hypothetical protein
VSAANTDDDADIVTTENAVQNATAMRPGIFMSLSPGFFYGPPGCAGLNGIQQHACHATDPGKALGSSMISKDFFPKSSMPTPASFHT